MADFWSSILFEASWGGVPIPVTDIRESGGRKVQAHEGAHWDGAEIEDLGREHRPVTMSAVFVGEKETDDYSRIMTLASLGRPQTLWHPLRGQFEAWLGTAEISATASEREAIAVTFTFHPDRRRPSVVEVGMGSPVESAIDEVDAAAAELEGALAGVGATSSVPDDAREAAQLWSEATQTADEVAQQLNGFSDDVDALCAEVDAATSIDSYPVAVASANLVSALRRAAESALTTSSSSRMMEITVGAPGPLLSILSGIYGARDALAYEDAVLAANSIPNPVIVEAGTVLRVPNPNTSAR